MGTEVPAVTWPKLPPGRRFRVHRLPPGMWGLAGWPRGVWPRPGPEDSAVRVRGAPTCAWSSLASADTAASRSRRTSTLASARCLTTPWRYPRQDEASPVEPAAWNTDQAAGWAGPVCYAAGMGLADPLRARRAAARRCVMVTMSALVLGMVARWLMLVGMIGLPLLRLIGASRPSVSDAPPGRTVRPYAARRGWLPGWHLRW